MSQCTAPLKTVLNGLASRRKHRPMRADGLTIKYRQITQLAEHNLALRGPQKDEVVRRQIDVVTTDQDFLVR